MSEPSEPSVFSIILNTLGLVARTVYGIEWSRYFSWLLRVIALPWKILLIPLSFFANVLLVLFAPILHLLSYFVSWARAVMAFIISLEPLFTFFGVAATVGIIAGIVTGLFSSTITMHLGMQGSGDSVVPASERKKFDREEEEEEDKLSESPSETEWQWLDSSSQGRRPVSGLLSETIHEEDDDSE